MTGVPVPGTDLAVQQQEAAVPREVSPVIAPLRPAPTRSARLSLLGVLLVCGACGAERAPSVQPFSCPAPAGSGEANLRAAGSRLYLSWIAGRGGHEALEYAVLEGGRWSEARTIATGDSFFVNWADFPSVAELGDGSLVAHWLWRSSADAHAYDVVLAQSADGVHWGRGQRPHRDGTRTEHGFVSLLPELGADATVVWLDGREYAQVEHAGDPEGHGENGHEDASARAAGAARRPDAEGVAAGQTQLLCATLTRDGISPERVLDPRVCDCCPTSAVRTTRGALVAYRDRSPDEVRDIYLVRLENGEWTEPYPLSNDHWQISGCPVNGPALAAAGERVAAAWFTLAGRQPAVRVALSTDGGRSFPVNVRADDGSPLGRVDVVLLPQGALVVWLESPPASDAMIRARRVRDDGALEPSFVVATTSADRASGYPQAARIGDHAYFAWTQAGEAAQIRMAVLDIPSSWR